MATAFVGVGSNVEPAENVRKALGVLSSQMRVLALSTVYETEPEGRPEQPRYYNCVVEIDTETPPGDLKRSLREIEDCVGRVRTQDKFAPRTIDLDLLLYDDVVIHGEELTLPDPEIAVRPYLAAGLAELAPDLTLPGTGERFAELAERLPKQGMRPLNQYSTELKREVLHGR
jgi:2-amino-4-hydroxy-6-hydroxymethyldihydropteridine diphosphokinase